MIYRGTIEDSLGNPTDVFVERKARARVEQTFSYFYYNEKGRSQQLSLNLSVNEYLTTPFSNEKGAIMTLYQVTVDNTRYNVKAVLNDRKNRLRKVLDCEQVLY